jgi:hypothetical protein
MARLDEEAVVAARRAAEQHVRSGARGAVEEAENALLLGGRDDRPHLDRRQLAGVAVDRVGERQQRLHPLTGRRVTPAEPSGTGHDLSGHRRRRRRAHPQPDCGTRATP